MLLRRTCRLVRSQEQRLVLSRRLSGSSGSKVYTRRRSFSSFSSSTTTTARKGRTQESLEAEKRKKVSFPVEKYSVHKSERIVVYAMGGNIVITIAKTLAAITSGSTAMAAEAVHSAADSMNQMLLLIGLRSATRSPDAKAPYGYGKSIYLWSLVSALGTFWLGGGVSLFTSVREIATLLSDNNALLLDAAPQSGIECAAVLGVSFLVDGFVLSKSVRHFLGSKPKERSISQHFKETRDPTVLAVLLEDAAACAGVLMASIGIATSRATGIALLDPLSGAGVGLLLGSVGLGLAALNARYLIGSAVDKLILDDIDAIVRAHPAIEDVHSVQSNVIGPDAFSYKCEIDFNAHYLALTLQSKYQPIFYSLLSKEKQRIDTTSTSSSQTGSNRLRRFLALYTEDVMAQVDKEVRDLERDIRAKHPNALFIEIEPDASAGFVLPDEDSDDFYLLDPPSQDEWSHIFVQDDEHEDVVLAASTRADDEHQRDRQQNIHQTRTASSKQTREEE